MKLGIFVVDEMVVIGYIRTNIEGQLPKGQVNRHPQMSSPSAGTFDLHLGSSHLNPELHERLADAEGFSDIHYR